MYYKSQTGPQRPSTFSRVCHRPATCGGRERGTRERRRDSREKGSMTEFNNRRDRKKHGGGTRSSFKKKRRRKPKEAGWWGWGGGKRGDQE